MLTVHKVFRRLPGGPSVFLPEVLPGKEDRGAPFQNTVIDTGMGQVRRVLEFGQLQVGGDYHGHVSFIFAAIFIGYAQGCAPVVSYHYGADNTDELKNLLRISLRFVIIGGIVFFLIAMMYGLAQESHRMNRIWPGAVFSLVMWLVLSFLFSYYVENIARYSVIYGTLGAVIVLLLWLYLASVMLIMGAEFNSVLMVLRKQHTAEAEENLGETQK